MSDIVLHLMTQDNQPYGSVRKCCEICGKMMEGDMCYTDSREIYKKPPIGEPNYIQCGEVIRDIY